jgi:SOS-response transcriptional repressor LexA
MVSDLTRPKYVSVVRERRKDLFRAAADAARVAGFSRSTWASIETGGINPTTLSAENQIGFLRALSWTPAQYHAATGERLVLAEAKLDQSSLPASSTPGRWVAATGSSSAGRPFDYIEWVEPDNDRPNLEIRIVEGPSMEPTLFDGDVAYVDASFRSRETLLMGEIYHVEIIGDGKTFKRLTKREDGKIQLTSDNPMYGSFSPDEVTVLGLVFTAKGPRDLRSAAWRSKHGR